MVLQILAGHIWSWHLEPAVAFSRPDADISTACCRGFAAKNANNLPSEFEMVGLTGLTYFSKKGLYCCLWGQFSDLEPTVIQLNFERFGPFFPAVFVLPSWYHKFGAGHSPWQDSTWKSVGLSCNLVAVLAVRVFEHSYRFLQWTHVHTYGIRSRIPIEEK